MRSKLAAGMVLVLVSVVVTTAEARVIRAIPDHAIHMPGNYLFYGFGYDPILDALGTATSSNNKSMNYVEIIDDTVNDGNGPWDVDFTVQMIVTELLDFGKNGDPLSTGGDHTPWGYKFCPNNSYYFATLHGGQLKNPDGSIKDEQCAIAAFDMRLPNGTDAAIGTNGLPAGALYDASADFAASGVVPGTKVTLVAKAGITSGTYVVTQLLDAHTVQLDPDPGHALGVVYYMKPQRWVTMADLRALDPVAFANPKTSCNCAAPPAVSQDGNTLYFRETTVGGVLQVSTSDPTELSVFVTNATLQDYVSAQMALGRKKAKSGDDFKPSGAKVMNEIATDTLGRVWFSEVETDDIIWTLDGVTLNTALTSSDIFAFYDAHGLPSAAGTGAYIMGLYVDKMGTIYWSDVNSHSIQKCPAIGGSANMRLLMTGSEAMALGTTQTGLSNMAARGTQLLFLTYGSSSAPGALLAVDMKTWQYGDFDGDFDNDLKDFALFQQCFGAAIAGDPEHPCNVCDVDSDEDVDLDDYVEAAKYATGPL